MNVTQTLQEKLVTDKRTLTEFHVKHINAVIIYLKGLKTDFVSAKRGYEKTMGKMER